MNLRRPTDSLAGCVWLPRLVDKARHAQAGTLHSDFVTPFCHPLATDGAFLSHFELSREEFLDAMVTAGGSDEAVARWFAARPQSSTERIAAWNELAPHIGKPGYPMHRGFQWMLKRLYGGTPPDPRVTSAFTAIAFDEGYLDELAPPARVSSGK
ncbi:MAG: DUF5069 domain-containing protein [Opitutaceae bacterium]|nr:DUF5069 domain-containing protein [Opitutaceae bacterium]